MLVLFSASSAQAQGYPGGGSTPYYAVTYSGGQSSSTGGPSLPLQGRQGTYSGGDNGTAYSGGDVAYGPNGYGASVSATGQITATFTWTPTPANEPPPASVIVEEDGTASYSTYGPATGNYDDGVGDVSPPNGTYASLSGTKYLVKTNPGTSFTETCSPSASASGPADPNGTYGSASVSFKAIPYPVTLTLTGTTKDSSGADNILIGQGCTASMSAGPATLSNYQWTILGDTFKSFVMGNTVGTILDPSHPYGEVSYLSSADLASPNPHWYWKSGYTFALDQTVYGSATASVNGTTLGTVTGLRNIAVWAPYHEFSYNAGAISIFSPGTSDVAIHGHMDWTGRVGTPDLFRSYWGSPGIWQFTQLCNLDRTLTPLNPMENAQGLYTNGSILDGGFNYSSVDGGPWPADSVSTKDANGNIITVGTEGVSGDVPTIGLDGMVEADIDDAFELRMMYYPPGTDVQWVPLHLLDWTMKCYASYGLQEGWCLSSPALCQAQSEGPDSTFPEWDGEYEGTH